MASQPDSAISRDSMMRFVQTLSRVTKKYEQREIARFQLKEQMERAKNISLSNTKSKWAIMREFDNLNLRVEDVIRREMEILHISKRDSEEISKLKEHLHILHDELDQLSVNSKVTQDHNSDAYAHLDYKLADMAWRLDNALGNPANRPSPPKPVLRPRLHKTEEKQRIRNSAKDDQQRVAQTKKRPDTQRKASAPARPIQSKQKDSKAELRSQLARLEGFHSKLLAAGHDPLKLDELKSRIDFLKEFVK